jgi:uncharacterized protein
MAPALWPRLVEAPIKESLARGKSVILLGPRQTGKTTLILSCLEPDISYNLMDVVIRQSFERDIGLFQQEILAEISTNPKFNKNSKDLPLVFIDEIQKLPILMDIIQILIDQKIAKFILTGSSARKLKHGANINLLPGRVTLHYLDPLMLQEHEFSKDIQGLLEYGSLPGIWLDSIDEHRQIDLSSYVATYLEDEIRQEALVRNVGDFSRFLNFAASESGYLINSSALSQSLGLSRHNINAFYQILEDCMIVHRVEPYLNTRTNRRLSKAVKYIFFDLGVRRIAAAEGVPVPAKMLGNLFEQWVGLELIKYFRFSNSATKIMYWRDHSGPEVDYILEKDQQIIPIEVKWSEAPNKSDIKHLLAFMKEHKLPVGYVVCRCLKKLQLADGVIAYPWGCLPELLSGV